MGRQYAYVANYRTNASEEVIEEKISGLPDTDDFHFEYSKGEVWISAFFYSSSSFRAEFEAQLYELIRSTLAEDEVATCYVTVDGEESKPDFIAREGDEVEARDAEVEYHKKKIKEHETAIKELLFHEELQRDLKALDS
jgi:hypothetical protein